MREHVSTFWFGDRLTPVEIACLRSFADNGIGVRFHSYAPVELPGGLEWVDANLTLPREQLFHFDSSPSAFSDLFRYKLLYEEGGWWVDTDVVFRGGGLPQQSHYWAWQDRTTINGAVLKFPRHDPLCGSLYEESLSRAPRLRGWGEIGPDLLTQLIGGGPYEGHSLWADTTYPLHWMQSHYFWFPEFRPVVEARMGSATFVHLWNSLYARMGLDLTLPLPKGSYLGDLIEPLFPGHVHALDEEGRRAAAEKVRLYLSADWVQPMWEKCMIDGERLLLPE